MFQRKNRVLGYQRSHLKAIYDSKNNSNSNASEFIEQTVLSIKNIRSYVSENLNIELTFLPWKNKF